jgi:hypothetical protein
MDMAQPTTRRDWLGIWIGGIAVTPMLALVAAELLMSQPNPTALLAGGLAHLVAIIASSLIILTFAKSPWMAATLILLALSLRLLGGDGVFRFGYLLVLAILFAAAGHCVATYARAPFLKALLFILAISVIVATAQLLGIHEAMYGWSAHGTLADGTRLVVNPTPTLFRAASELDSMNFVQARPSSIFASNQYFSIFLLFVASLVILMRGKLAFTAAVLLGLGAALSLAKAVIFGIPILAIAAFLLLPTARRQAMRVIGSLIAALILYKLFFPGTFSLMFNPQIIMTSFLVRAISVLDGLGLNVFVQDMEKYSDYAQQIITQIEATQFTRDGGATSLYAQIMMHPIHTIFVVGIIAILSFTAGGWISSDRLRENAIIALSILMIGVVADVSKSMLFWHWAVVGAAFLFTRAFCPLGLSPLGGRLARTVKEADPGSRESST